MTKTSPRCNPSTSDSDSLPDSPLAWIRWARSIGDSLKGPARAVLLALATFADASGRCWPSTAALARASGLSAATVKRARRRLKRDGWVEVSRRESGRGGCRSNSYRLVHQCPDASESTAAPRVTLTHGSQRPNPRVRVTPSLGSQRTYPRVSLTPPPGHAAPQRDKEGTGKNQSEGTGGGAPPPPAAVAPRSDQIPEHTVNGVPLTSAQMAALLGRHESALCTDAAYARHWQLLTKGGRRAPKAEVRLDWEARAETRKPKPTPDRNGSEPRAVDALPDLATRKELQERHEAALSSNPEYRQWWKTRLQATSYDLAMRSRQEWESGKAD